MFNFLQRLFHKHHYEPTGLESLRGLDERTVEKIKLTKCVICGKPSEEHISFKRV